MHRTVSQRGSTSSTPQSNWSREGCPLPPHAGVLLPCCTVANALVARGGSAVHDAHLSLQPGDWGCCMPCAHLALTSRGSACILASSA